MRIRLLAFATASEAIGADALELDVEPGSDVASLKTLLEERFPDLGGLWQRLAVAVDGEIADGSTPLAPGCEVALLPPVSGGAAAPADRVAITTAPLELEGILDLVRHPGAGALVVFVGTVRDQFEQRAVERLTYTAYETMARSRLERIVRDLEREHAPARIAIHHRLGTLEVGEPSVVIAAASAHRDGAYRASREALERLKAEVPIWKREHYVAGEAAWREEEPLIPESAR